MLKILLISDNPEDSLIINKIIANFKCLVSVDVLCKIDSLVSLYGCLINKKVDILIIDREKLENNNKCIAGLFHNVDDTFPCLENQYNCFFLSRPISEERFVKYLLLIINKKNISKYSSLDNNGNGKIILNQNNNYTILNIPDIYFIEKEKNKKRAYVVTSSDTYIVNQNLENFINYLNTGTFLRSHKSFIVNSQKVFKIIPYNKSTYKVLFEDIKNIALLSADKFPALKKLLLVQNNT